MQYAYVTFLMRGDGYLPGALVLGYVLRQQSSIDRICLVTDDVSNAAITALKTLYTNVIQIDKLQFKKTVKTGRRDRNLLPTRFKALCLSEYDKIILLDADVLPLADYDSLFELNTPAGIIMEEKTSSYSLGEKDGENHKWSWHDLYEPICPHGTPIPKNLTDKVRLNTANMGVNSGLWVLHPSMDEYENLIAAMKEKEIVSLVKNFPWPEMQLATLIWSGRWTNIDIRYCSIGGFPKINVLNGIHYAGLKPWQKNHRSIHHYARFPDFQLWYGFFKTMYHCHPEFQKIPGLKKLYEWCYHK